jgi:hypothetical protein
VFDVDRDLLQQLDMIIPPGAGDTGAEQLISGLGNGYGNTIGNKYLVDSPTSTNRAL